MPSPSHKDKSREHDNMVKEKEKVRKRVDRARRLKALLAEKEASRQKEGKYLARLSKDERLQIRLEATRARIESLKKLSTSKYEQEKPRGKGKKKEARMQATIESQILDEIRREENKLELERLKEELKSLQEEAKHKKPKTERVRRGKVKKSPKKQVRKEVRKSKEKDTAKVVIADLSSILEEENYIEGKKSKRYGNYYERNPKLRIQAILHHGTSCMACGFDFGEIYGEHGTGFIEVHHLQPLSELEEETKIDPKTDMAVVCSNCHKMIHRRRDNTLSLKELRKILGKKG